MVKVLSLSKTAVAATTNQLPSAAPMAVAQPIVAKTLQAPASQMQAQAPSNKGSLGNFFLPFLVSLSL